VGALVDAEVTDLPLGEEPLEPRLISALRQPEPPGGPEAPPVGADAGLHLKPAARQGRDQRQDSMGRRRGDQLDLPGTGLPKRVGGIAPEPGEAIEGGSVAVGGAGAGGLEL
jgi:hypothetical protein